MIGSLWRLFVSARFARTLGVAGQTTPQEVARIAIDLLRGAGRIAIKEVVLGTSDELGRGFRTDSDTIITAFWTPIYTGRPCARAGMCEFRTSKRLRLHGISRNIETLEFRSWDEVKGNKLVGNLGRAGGGVDLCVCKGAR